MPHILRASDRPFVTEHQGRISLVARANLGTSADRPKICCVAGQMTLDAKRLALTRLKSGTVLRLAKERLWKGQISPWDSDAKPTPRENQCL